MTLTKVSCPKSAPTASNATDINGICGNQETVSPAITIATILISLIRMFKLGPEVSLNGSPTVSPTTVARWTSLPLPPKFPSSTNFLALSHAPPAFAMKMASTKPEDNPPISNPMTPGTPNKSPVRMGAEIMTVAGPVLPLSDKFWVGWYVRAALAVRAEAYVAVVASDTTLHPGARVKRFFPLKAFLHFRLKVLSQS